MGKDKNHLPILTWRKIRFLKVGFSFSFESGFQLDRNPEEVSFFLPFFGQEAMPTKIGNWNSFLLVRVKKMIFTLSTLNFV